MLVKAAIFQLNLCGPPKCYTFSPFIRTSFHPSLDHTNDAREYDPDAQGGLDYVPNSQCPFYTQRLNELFGEHLGVILLVSKPLVLRHTCTWRSFSMTRHPQMIRPGTQAVRSLAVLIGVIYFFLRDIGLSEQR
jgi:hypothetical protein